MYYNTLKIRNNENKMQVKHSLVILIKKMKSVVPFSLICNLSRYLLNTHTKTEKYHLIRFTQHRINLHKKLPCINRKLTDFIEFINKNLTDFTHHGYKPKLDWLYSV